MSVVIHCNQGLSRAPSIALLWLAKRAKAISSSESYAAAAQAFLEIYPELGQQRRALRRQHGMQGKGHGVGSTGRDPAL